MKPEIHTATAETVQTGSDQAVAPAAPCSPVVTWQEAKLRSMNDEAVALNAWVLAVDGKAILTAVAGSEIHEAVTPENRKLIGKALAEYLANVQAEPRRP